MLIDKATEEVIEEDKGGEDGAPNFKNKEDIENVDEQGNSTNGQRGGEGGEAGEDGEAEEGKVAEEEGGPVELNQEEFKASILGEVKELFQSQQRAPQKEKEEVPAELTEDQKTAYEDQYGVPFRTIQAFTKQNTLLFDRVSALLDERLSKFERGDSIRELSTDPEFSDAMKHRKDIDEFMNGFDPKFRNDPKLLKSAVYYARGKNAKSAVSRARNDGERNRKIAGTFRPSSPSGGKKNGSRSLNESEKQAMQLGGFKNEADYLKYKGTKIFDNTAGS